MPNKISIIKTEITDDPLARGYSGMADAEVAADGYLTYRPIDTITIENVVKFLLLDNTYSTDGDDTQDRSIWQRMKEVVSLAIVPISPAPPNPWGSSSIGNITEIQQIKTHQLLDYFTLSAQGDLAVDLEDSNFQVYLAGAQSSGCMSTAQETALLDLANNLQSRWAEMGISNVKEGHVAQARA